MSTPVDTKDQDRVLLIAVVQWEGDGIDDVSRNGGTVKTSKIRVRQTDLFNDGCDKDLREIPICTGSTLVRVVREELEKNNILNIRTDNDCEFHIDIYDEMQSSYVALHAGTAHWNQDVAQHFGTRLMMQLRVTKGEGSDWKQREVKAIMGRFYPYNATEGFNVAGTTLRIHENSNQQNAGTGVNLWDGAILLARYLEKQPSLVKSKKVLELGAGCGLVGLAAGVLGAQEVLLTDLPYCLPNMRDNVSRHEYTLRQTGCEKVVCGACDWYNPPSLEELAFMMGTTNDRKEDTMTWKPDIILIADCVWMQDLVAPLLSTINRLTQQARNGQSTHPLVLISYQRRGKATHEEFWTGLHGLFDALIEDVNVQALGLDKPESIHLLSMNFSEAKTSCI